MLRQKLLLGLLVASCTWAASPVVQAAPDETAIATEDYTEGSTEDSETETETSSDSETEAETEAETEKESIDYAAIMETVPYDAPDGYAWSISSDDSSVHIVRLNDTVPPLVYLQNTSDTSCDVDEVVIFVTNLETEETQLVHITKDMDYQAVLPWASGYFKITSGNLAWEDSSGATWVVNSNQTSYYYIGSNYDSSRFPDYDSSFIVGNADSYGLLLHEWKTDYVLENGTTVPYREEEDNVSRVISYDEEYTEEDLMEAESAESESATDSSDSENEKDSEETEALIETDTSEETTSSRTGNMFFYFVKKFLSNSWLLLIALIVLVPTYLIREKKKQMATRENDADDEKALEPRGRKVGMRKEEPEEVISPDEELEEGDEEEE